MSVCSCPKVSLYKLYPVRHCISYLCPMLTSMASGAMTFCMFILRFVVFDLQESPKYLIANGRDREAYEARHLAIYLFIYLIIHIGPSTHSKIQRQNNPTCVGRAASRRRIGRSAPELLAAYKRIVRALVNVRFALNHSIRASLNLVLCSSHCLREGSSPSILH